MPDLVVPWERTEEGTERTEATSERESREDPA